MNNRDECTCGELRSAHFESTGKCAKISCRCTGFEAKPPFFLPHFEVDENTTWKRLLGELTFEVASVRDGIDEVRNRAVTYDDLAALSAVVDQNEFQRHVDRDRDNEITSSALYAIEEQLPNFKLSRKGKRKGKK